MTKGYICLVLHAHLPFVRHPQDPHRLEENWYYQAVSESFLPLLRMLRTLREDGIPLKLALSVSPTLCAMMGDELLQDRFEQYLRNQILLGEKEVKRADDAAQRELAAGYLENYRKSLGEYTEHYKGSLIRGLRELKKAGDLEIITTGASYSFMPLFESYPQANRAQIEAAVISHYRYFDDSPRGFWLPECGYYPGLECFLKREGFNYFFTSSNGFLNADVKPPYGVYTPVKTPCGIHAFGLDAAAMRDVTASPGGYLTDFSYRDFQRDIAFERNEAYLGYFVYKPGIRVNTGYKYYAKRTDEGGARLYDPRMAAKKASDHGENFLYKRLLQAERLQPLMNRPPLSVCVFDAGLFGRWWFEGPLWLESVIRRLHGREDLQLITPGEYLKLYPENPVSVPDFSSWGNMGYAQVWLNGSNHWIYRHLHKAIERLTEMVEKYPHESGLKEWVLNQAAREVILSQASDWPFIMQEGFAVPYAEQRVREHLYNFNRIYEDLCRNTVDTEWLTRLEKQNNCFPDLNYRIFKRH
ncbi:MAG: DUF1957 domain-containing protein [Spirochaetales bacterium]|jgi:1,4-alpha-glucan branching enzyme|nr:DUF1957 domain-containing protein [Spirochaetales bacterium]